MGLPGRAERVCRTWVLGLLDPVDGWGWGRLPGFQRGIFACFACAAGIDGPLRSRFANLTLGMWVWVAHR